MYMVAALVTGDSASVNTRRIQQAILDSATPADRVEHVFVEKRQQGFAAVVFTSHTLLNDAVQHVDQLVRRTMAANISANTKWDVESVGML